MMAREVPLSQSLVQLRHEIECIDRSILLLLAARLDAAQRAIQLRAPRSGRVTDRAQERQVLLRSQHLARELGLPRKLIDNLFRSLLEEGKTRFQTGQQAPDLPAVTILLAAPAESGSQLRRGSNLQLGPIPSSG